MGHDGKNVPFAPFGGHAADPEVFLSSISARHAAQSATPMSDYITLKRHQPRRPAITEEPDNALPASERAQAEPWSHQRFQLAGLQREGLPKAGVPDISVVY